MLASVSLEHFKSFDKRQALILPTQPGLYFISGRNEENLLLQGNGVGKSSLWDAVRWCLFGVASRGQRASNIITWGQKTAKVSIVWGGKTITRTQSPNSLLLDEAPITEEQLQRELRISPTVFDYCILFGQFASSFFDLSPTEKLELFSQILGLGFWFKCADAAKAAVINLERELNKLAGERSRQQGRMEELNSNAAILKTEIETWENTRRFTIEKLKNELRVLKADLECVEKELQENRVEPNPAPPIVELEAEVNSLRSELSAAVAMMKISRARIQKLGSLGAVCGECGQQISGEHVRQQHRDEESKLVDFQAIASTLEVKLNVASGKLEARRRAREQALRLQDMRTERLQFLSNEQKRIIQHAQSIANQIEDTKGMSSSAFDRLKNCELSLIEVSRQIDALTQKFDATSVELERAKFWVSGFKDLRLWLIDKSLLELEIEVNNSLIQLGLKDWSVSFDVQRENKSGGVSRGFTVNVSAPGVKSASWNNWSGGELQRLRIAGAIGFGNLLLNRLGYSGQCIEVWDEPTAHLSTQGIEDLLEWLRSRSQSEGKQIWVIDHHSLDFGGFDGRLEVVKAKDGSHIEVL